MTSWMAPMLVFHNAANLLIIIAVIVIIIFNGLQHWWTSFLRTLPDIAVLLEPLRHLITDILIPAVIEHAVTEVEHDLLANTVGLGGLDLVKLGKQSLSILSPQFKL